MTDFLTKLKSGYQEFNIENSSILLAVSGGPDSIALLSGSVAIQNDLGIQITAAHLNHSLRGTTSDEDAHWLEKTCDNLKVPLVQEKQDIQQFAKSEQIGIEEAARKARYRFLQKTAKDRSCTFLAVAHTANDQTETVLHHIIRGTGISGLQGIPSWRKLDDDLTLIRPMLSISRKSVENYLSEVGQEFRIDATNEDSQWTRNRIRNELLPQLRKDFNPKIDEALLRLASQSADISVTIDYMVNQILQKAIVDIASDAVRINSDELISLPRNLIRECFKSIWITKNWPRQRMGFTEWDKLAEITIDGGSYTFPGTIQVEKRNQLLICRKEANSTAK